MAWTAGVWKAEEIRLHKGHHFQSLVNGFQKKLLWSTVEVFL